MPKKTFFLMFMVLFVFSAAYSSDPTNLFINTINHFTTSQNTLCHEEGEIIKPFGLTITDKQKWKKTTITVCWAKKSDEDKICRTKGHLPKIEVESDEFKKEIQDIITKEYTKEKTGIYFTGWNNCSDGGAYDVMLFATSFSNSIIQGAAGEASIGPCTQFSDNPAGRPYVILGARASNLKLDVIDDLRMTALHEFGHLAGLYHEHLNLPEVVTMLAQRNETYVQTSSLDDHSVMNYQFNENLRKNGFAFIQRKDQRVFAKGSNIVAVKSIDDSTEEVNVRIGLSNGDLNALRCLYVYSASEKKKQCNGNLPP